VRTAAKWVARFRGGDRELLDRSSRPRRSPRRLAVERVQAIERLRRVRMTAGEIAEVLGLPLSTVSLWLKRIGLGNAYAEVLATLTARDAAGFLRRAIAWYAARGITVKAVMSDNGSAYLSDLYARTLRELKLRHLRIKPRRPRTNGKAERLIQTLLNESAYAQIYGSSAERTAALPLYLNRYNYRRPHGSLSHQPPASRLNNVVGNYT
jgi:transposase InsO family protein